MNNMNGIISECQHIYNSEVEIKDTKTKPQNISNLKENL